MEKNNVKLMSAICRSVQFLCLKNIRTFLTSCCDVFGIKKSDLFEAFDLFDVRDFGKVTSHIHCNVVHSPVYCVLTCGHHVVKFSPLPYFSSFTILLH